MHTLKLLAIVLSAPWFLIRLIERRRLTRFIYFAWCTCIGMLVIGVVGIYTSPINSDDSSGHNWIAAGGFTIFVLLISFVFDQNGGVHRTLKKLVKRPARQ